MTGGATTHYIWQASQVIAEHNGSTGVVVTDYVYSGRRMIANVSAGSTQYFLSDRLSARMTLDSSGSVLGRQSYLPFGEDFAESGTQEKHHFTGYERDSESGTDYAVNRGYAPVVGRFMRPDPHRGSAVVDAPQSLNRYAYVRNDPVNLNDPLGLIVGDIIIIPGSWCVLWPAACGSVDNTFGLPRTFEPEAIPKGSVVGLPDPGVYFTKATYGGNEFSSTLGGFIDVVLSTADCTKDSVFEVTVYFRFEPFGHFVRDKSDVRASKERMFKVLDQKWTDDIQGGRVTVKLQNLDSPDARRFTLTVTPVMTYQDKEYSGSGTVRIRCP